jgi:hypothetical protein
VRGGEAGSTKLDHQPLRFGDGVGFGGELADVAVVDVFEDDFGAEFSGLGGEEGVVFPGGLFGDAGLSRMAFTRKHGD